LSILSSHTTASRPCGNLLSASANATQATIMRGPARSRPFRYPTIPTSPRTNTFPIATSAMPRLKAYISVKPSNVLECARGSSVTAIADADPVFTHLAQWRDNSVVQLGCPLRCRPKPQRPASHPHEGVWSAIAGMTNMSNRAGHRPSLLWNNIKKICIWKQEGSSQSLLAAASVRS